MAHRARAAGDSDPSVTTKVGQLAATAAEQGGVSSTAAKAMAVGAAAEAVASTSLEPVLLVVADLSTTAGPPNCEWTKMRKPFIESVATMSGISSDYVAILSEPSCPGTSSGAGGGGRRRLRRSLSSDVSVKFAIRIPSTKISSSIKNLIVSSLTDGTLASEINSTMLSMDPTATPLLAGSVSRPSNPSEVEVPARTPLEVGQQAAKAAAGAGMADTAKATEAAAASAAKAVAES